MTEEVGRRRLSGLVAAIVREKNYGFISPDDPNTPELFFHASAYDGDFSQLRPGDPVTYIQTATAKGARAVAVGRQTP